MKRNVFFTLFLFCATLLSAQNPNFFNVKDFGASGKKAEKQTAAIQKTIDACHSAGGGTVYFPPGDYLSGTIVLKDNVTMHLEGGATLWASPDPQDYENEFIVYKKNDSGKQGDGATPVLIYAKGAKNISISGKGTINGQARRTYEPLKKVDGFIAEETENARKSGIEMKMYYKVKPYTCMVFLEDCEFVHIRDASFVESTDWTLHFKWCRRVFVDNIYLESSLEKGVNADGIDVDGCHDVTISNCIISTGDDAIVLKSTQTFDKFRSCENVTVSNCVLTSTSTALKLGTESFGDFRHIVFNNCVIRNTNRGLSIVVRDGATVSDVLFSNITIECDRKHFNWWGNGDPIWLVLKKRYPDSKLGKIQHVTFQNIMAHGQGTSKIEGFPGKPLENITLDNVQLFMNPEDKPDKRATHGFFARNVNHLSLSGVKVHWNTENPEPKWQSAFAFKNVKGLRLDKLHGKQAPTAKSPAIVFNNVKDAIVERCFAPRGTQTFLEVKGKSENITLYGNYLKNARKKIELSGKLPPETIQNRE